MAFRVIPTLTISSKQLYRTTQFKNPLYVGDPMNAVSIFNNKEVDELVLFDISPNLELNEGHLKFLSSIASHAFCPMSYGGGIRTLEHIDYFLKNGFEKVVLNTMLVENPALVKEAVAKYGSQAIVGIIDYKKGFFNKKTVFTNGGKKNTGIPVDAMIDKCRGLELGEIGLRSIDHDGLMAGLDFEALTQYRPLISTPLMAIGGTGNMDHILKAKELGVDSVAAGSFFVYHGKHKAVLLKYLDNSFIETYLRE